jgi:hypothetical protein
MADNCPSNTEAAHFIAIAKACGVHHDLTLRNKQDFDIKILPSQKADQTRRSFIHFNSLESGEIFMKHLNKVHAPIKACVNKQFIAPSPRSSTFVCEEARAKMEAKESKTKQPIKPVIDDDGFQQTTKKSRRMTSEQPQPLIAPIPPLTQFLNIPNLSAARFAKEIEGLSEKAKRKQKIVYEEEKRFAKDGFSYTKQEFLDWYKDSYQWDNAPRKVSGYISYARIVDPHCADVEDWGSRLELDMDLSVTASCKSTPRTTRTSTPGTSYDSPMTTHNYFGFIQQYDTDSDDDEDLFEDSTEC